MFVKGQLWELLLNTGDENRKWEKRGDTITNSASGGIAVNQQNGKVFAFTSDEDQVWIYDHSEDKWTLKHEKAFMGGKRWTRFVFVFGPNRNKVILPVMGFGYGLYDMTGEKVISDVKTMIPLKVSNPIKHLNLAELFCL